MQAITPVRLAALAAAAVFGCSFAAFANPRPLPFTYQHEQLGEGDTTLIKDFLPESITVDAFEKLLSNYASEQELKMRLQSAHRQLVDQLQSTVASIADAQRERLKTANQVFAAATKEIVYLTPGLDLPFWRYLSEGIGHSGGNRIGQRFELYVEIVGARNGDRKR